MLWTAPILVEVCIGLEINGYLPAEFWSMHPRWPETWQMSESHVPNREDWIALFPATAFRQEETVPAGTCVRGMQQAARGKLLIHWVHIAALADSNRTSPPQLLSIQNAARARGIECCVHQIEKSEEIAAAIEAAKGSGAAALTF